MSRSSSDEAVLACPACARRYPLDQRFCVHCGMPLVGAGEATSEEPRSEAHARARKIKPEYASGELVRVASGRNQAEAELIQNLLIEEGVPSMLRRTRGFDVPDFLAAGPRDVLVPQSGVGAARGTLLEAELVSAEDQGVGAPSGRHTALVLGAILGGGAVAALIAWWLLQAA